jgi:predicted Fe-Mo cluster-binding NifX family protein
MKIAISSTGPKLENAVDQRFGRCPYFIIIDPETMVYEAFPNPSGAQSGGAGIQAAQSIAERGVAAVLTGNCGPNAVNAFGAAGIQVINGVAGSVRQAVEQYVLGSLPRTDIPGVQSQPGKGMGRGMGGGGGRGMGGGRRMR